MQDMNLKEKEKGDHGGRDIHYAWITQSSMNYIRIPLTIKARVPDATKSPMASNRDLH